MFILLLSAKCLKIPKGDNQEKKEEELTIIKNKRLKWQSIVYKTLYRKLLIEQYTNTNKNGGGIEVTHKTMDRQHNGQK
jgi:hypothetical protein